MTEVETLLLDSLKKLTRESGEREQRLIEAFESRVKLLNQESAERERQLEVRLNGLTSRLEATTGQLNDMTSNYQSLSQQIRILSKLLDGTSSDSANAKKQTSIGR